VCLHFLAGVLKDGCVVLGPLNVSARGRTQLSHLALCEQELAHLDCLSLKRVAAVGPREEVGVIEATVFEQCAVNRGL